jgi:hypothetical protein
LIERVPVLDKESKRLRMEAPASEEAAAPRSAGTTVDQLNGVWNSEWERSNPFGPAAPATAKAVFAKLYHACSDTEDSRAALLPT